MKMFHVERFNIYKICYEMESMRGAGLFAARQSARTVPDALGPAAQDRQRAGRHAGSGYEHAQMGLAVAHLERPRRIGRLKALNRC